jgi:hypothetical protein
VYPALCVQAIISAIRLLLRKVANDRQANGFSVVDGKEQVKPKNKPGEVDQAYKNKPDEMPSKWQNDVEHKES